MISLAARAPSRAQEFERPPLRIAGEETGGEQVAGAGGVDEIVDGRCRNFPGFFTLDDDSAFFGAGDRGDHFFPAQRRDRRGEIRGLVQSVKLGLVGEQNIHQAVAHQTQKFPLVAIDAKHIRQKSAPLPVPPHGRRATPR